MKSFLFSIFILFFFHCILIAQPDSSLSLVTLNVWSGIDYDGIISMGEYESESEREARFSSLLQQIRSISPDVLFLQEVNPAGAYAKRLADSLGYDEIHQVCISGIKFGPLGIPLNLKEGNAILAKKELEIEEVDELKLSGSIGLHGETISLHFSDAIFALIGKVKVNGSEIYLVNTHLSADSGSSGSQKRVEEVEELLEYINSKLNDYPVILAGDFNASPESPEIILITGKNTFSDSFRECSSPGYTWDPENNDNIKFSLAAKVPGLKEPSNELIGSRIDYIFFNDFFGKNPVVNSEVVMNKSLDGILPSDHYGISCMLSTENLPARIYKTNESNWDALPIASYDSDFGFGAGFKAFLLNQLDLYESLDFTFYYSSKGERWYRFVFSLPDFEVRQKKVYQAALDFIIDYDRMNSSSFFGIGNTSEFDNREYYTREPFEIKLQFSRGISPVFVAQIGLKYKYVRNFNFKKESLLQNIGPGKSSYSGIYLTGRYDTRNSFINPEKGVVTELEAEYAPDVKINKASFERFSLTLQYFKKIFYPKTIFASRINFQSLFGSSIPVQNLLSIGGNNSLRGFSQDRFMDKTSMVCNAELRFPILWRFGGILGVDAGNVWSKPGEISFADWKINPAAGIRFYFDTFIVRMDLGLSSETTGFYLNFGHIF